MIPVTAFSAHAALWAALALASAAWAVLIYLDVTSTLSFLKRKTAVEGGLFGVIAALQALYPKAWPWIKTALSLAILLALLASILLGLMPLRVAVAVMAVLDFLYLMVWLKNWSVNK